MSTLLRLARWVMQKFAAAILIFGLGLAGCALWLFLKDNVDFDLWRQDMLRTLAGERAKVVAAREDVVKRMDRISLEITTEEERGKQADKVIAQLRELESTWDRLVGNREQQEVNDQRLKKMTELRQSTTARVQQLHEEFKRTTWERDGLDIALGRLDARLAVIQKQQSKILHYLERTWNYPIGRGVFTLPLKAWFAVALAVYFLGPTTRKVGMYFFVAPIIARGRPVRLAKTIAALPEVSESRAATEIALPAGERLWVKERFLQASDEGLRRRTRYLLDWKIPFTCLATGLIELIEMRSEAADGNSEHRVTLSKHGDPQSELAVVTLPEGAALVLRPSFLAGVVVGGGRRLKIRRRWTLFRWQAWATLQFRFFEFSGPCRLIVAGSRGVRAERLVDRPGDGVPARRTNQDSTMGFTPNLEYRPVRAETFWSYYRGMNPLFDDLFAGRGIFLCQQVSSDGEAKKARKFWSSAWSGLMKIFGV